MVTGQRMLRSDESIALIVWQCDEIRRLKFTPTNLKIKEKFVDIEL